MTTPLRKKHRQGQELYKNYSNTKATREGRGKLVVTARTKPKSNTTAWSKAC